jgi:hypothetical protein
MNIQKIVIASALALASVQVFGQNYGMAGCGLGSIVTKEMGWGDDMMQILAATTNGTAYSQTFGISTGTSNCGGAAIEATEGLKKKTAQQTYLKYNLTQVKADAAKGEGDYIEGLAGLFGCQNRLTGSFSDFADLSRQNFEQIFTSDESDVVWNNYIHAIQSAKINCHQG